MVPMREAIDPHRPLAQHVTMTAGAGRARDGARVAMVAVLAAVGAEAHDLVRGALRVRAMARIATQCRAAQMRRMAERLSREGAALPLDVGVTVQTGVAATRDVAPRPRHRPEATHAARLVHLIERLVEQREREVHVVDTVAALDELEVGARILPGLGRLEAHARGARLQLPLERGDTTIDAGLPCGLESSVTGAVARHARGRGRARDDRPGRTVVERGGPHRIGCLVVTTLAGHTCDIHRVRHRRHAMSPDTGVQILLRRMTAAVTAAAVPGALVVRDRRLRRQLAVLDREVAVLAIHLVLGDVLLVQEDHVVGAREQLRIVVTGEAALLGHRAIATHDVAMAAIARHAEAVHLTMVEGHALPRHDLLRHLVARQTRRPALIERLVLEVAQRAGRGRDRDVLGACQLRVARRAAQTQAVATLGQVRTVIERAGLEGLASGQQAALVAAHAGRVIDLAPRLRARGAREVLGDHGQGLELLLGLRRDAGRDVALDARHLIVLGVLPRLIVGLHVVALVAEVGRARHLHHPEHRDHAEADQEHHHRGGPLRHRARQPRPDPLGQRGHPIPETSEQGHESSAHDHPASREPRSRMRRNRVAVPMT